MKALRTSAAHCVYLIFIIFCRTALANDWQNIDKPVPDAVSWGQVQGQDVEISGPSLINFWATWCAPCIQELPDLGQAAESLNGDVSVILVNVGESEEQIERFFANNPDVSRDHPWQMSQGFGFEGMQQLQLRGLPTTLLVVDGVIRAQVQGIKAWHEPDELDQIRALAAAE